MLESLGARKERLSKHPQRRNTLMNWKLMGAGAGVAAAAALGWTLMDRGDTTAAAEATAESPAGNGSFFSRFTGPEEVTLPAESKISIRLEQAISTEKNTSGDTFTGWLDGPLTVDGKTVAPSRSKVTGKVTQVKDAGRVEGLASLTMVLDTLEVNGEEYDLETLPLSRVARNTKKKDAAIIGGSAAAGAVIGAIAGGGKGAAIGAGVGGGSGTGYVLATKGEPVEFAPETRLTFYLSEPVELPVYEFSESPS
jgi:hypothetical protein